jgi:hypothetical protein
MCVLNVLFIMNNRDSLTLIYVQLGSLSRDNGWLSRDNGWLSLYNGLLS